MEYITGERYFFITTSSLLNTEIPNVIKDKMHYYNIINGEKIYKSVTMKQAANIVRELVDGNFAVSIQLSPWPLKSTHCVYHNITEEDFNEAVLYYGQYGITEFLTLEEFKLLQFKEIN